MNQLPYRGFWWLSLPCLVLTWMLATGCGKEAAPPKPIALDQIPTSLQQAFKGAGPDAKRVADAVVAAVGAKDYTKALFALQTLAGRSDLSPEQRDLAARSMLAVNQALSEQAGSGNQEAQQALQFQRTTR